MKVFKEEHGHCLVPQMYPELGQWVHGQRQDYLLLSRGQKSPLTTERLAKLQSVGFVFRTGKVGGRQNPFAPQGPETLDHNVRETTEDMLERDQYWAN